MTRRHPYVYCEMNCMFGLSLTWWIVRLTCLFTCWFVRLTCLSRADLYVWPVCHVQTLLQLRINHSCSFEIPNRKSPHISVRNWSLLTTALNLWRLLPFFKKKKNLISQTNNIKRNLLRSISHFKLKFNFVLSLIKYHQLPLSVDLFLRVSRAFSTGKNRIVVSELYQRPTDCLKNTLYSSSSPSLLTTTVVVAWCWSFSLL